MKKVFLVIFIIPLIAVILTSCYPFNVKMDVAAANVVLNYFNKLMDKDYRGAYDCFLPEIRKKETLDAFVKNIENVVDSEGEIQGIQIRDEVELRNRKEYIFDVDIATTKKIIWNKVEVIKTDKWYLKKITPISYKLKPNIQE